MRRLTAWTVMCLGSAFWWMGPARPQSRGSDWTTSGHDAQRSSWVRTDSKITTESVRQPAFRLAWKLKFDNRPRQLNALTQPVLLDFYIGYRGFRSLAFIGGSSDNIFVVDTDLARMEWEKSFESGSPQDGSLDCPGGLTANLTRPTDAGLPPLSGFSGFGRRSPGRSGVGEPHEGAITLAEAGKHRFRMPESTGSSRERKRGNPFRPGPSYVYALSSDGMLHTMYVSNGDNGLPSVKFLPPNANAQGLIVVDDVAYVATSHGCGGVANGVWALDLASNKVVTWKPDGGGVAGVSGLAIGPEGTIYVATGEGPDSKAASSYGVAALEPKTLKQTDWYTAGSHGFTSSPVVLDYQERDLLAVTAKDGRIYLLDGASLGGADHRTPLYKTPVYSTAADFVPGALATWRDADGAAWVLAPAAGPLASGVTFPVTNGEVKDGAILAWKVVEKNGAAALEPGWTSRDLVSPAPPIVVNGVVFALSSGEFRTSDRSMTAAQRAQRSSPAVLYALDGATGKVLWESGNSIKSFAHGGGLSAGGSRVYVGTHDGTLYAFGFPIEH